MKYFLVFAVAFLFSLYSFGQIKTNYIDSLGVSVADIKEELLKIKENYYVIMPYGIAGNIGVYIGKENVILIDDQWSILSTRIKEILKTITDKPIKYIINTHFHFDHVDGNKSFGKENIPIISHKNVRERLSKDQVLSSFVLQKAYPADGLPTITFNDSMQLFEDKEVFELIHFKNAHTDGDVIIHFKEADIYHTGDIFVTYGLPFIDENNGGDIYGMIGAIDYLLSVSDSETKFIPGHGPVCSIKELSGYSKLLTSIKDQVANLIKKGVSIDKIINEVEIDEKIKGVDKKDFISHVYRMVLKRNLAKKNKHK